MRICFDGTFWGPGSPPSGMHVTHDLIRTWSDRYPLDVVTVVVPAADAEEARDQLRDRPAVTVQPSSQMLGRLPQAVSALLMGWKPAGAFRRGGNRQYDAVLTHNFSSLSRHQVTACLVHDALFVEHPAWFTRPELVYFRAIRPSLRRADIVLTTSASETGRIERLWPEVRPRTRSIGLAPSSDIVDGDPEKPTTAPDTAFVLAVGRLNTRKNLGRLISAFHVLRKARPKLSMVIVGGRDGSSEALGDDTGVHFTGRISDAELVWFYQHCRAFVFPSLGEGFGMPLLEADAFGVPIVCSDLPVFRELGVADEYFDPNDVRSIEVALDKVLTTHRHRAPRRRADHHWPAVVEAARGAILERLEK